MAVLRLLPEDACRDGDRPELRFRVPRLRRFGSLRRQRCTRRQCRYLRAPPASITDRSSSWWGRPLPTSSSRRGRCSARPRRKSLRSPRPAVVGTSGTERTGCSYRTRRASPLRPDASGAPVQRRVRPRRSSWGGFRNIHVRHSRQPGRACGKGKRRGHSLWTSSLNAGSSRIGSKSESSAASAPRGS